VLDGTEQKGVGCSVRLEASNYAVPANLTQSKNTLSKMAYEMALNNAE